KRSGLLCGSASACQPTSHNPRLHIPHILEAFHFCPPADNTTKRPESAPTFRVCSTKYKERLIDPPGQHTSPLSICFTGS
ncbi:hypothetical protein DFH11DRAFT_1858993, partial [Phellopilus nigrolimitatus]